MSQTNQTNQSNHLCPKCKSPLYYLDSKGNVEPADTLTRNKLVASLDLENGEGDVESLPAVKYRCPGCGKMEMRLVDVGCWD